MAEAPQPTGDQLLKVLTALGNPHRMRIVAALAGRRNYVSALAREIGMGRPLLHMHLKRLEAAGVIAGTLEADEDGRVVRYFEVTPFLYVLTPEVVARSVSSLTDTDDPPPAKEAGPAAEAMQPAREEAQWTENR